MVDLQVGKVNNEIGKEGNVLPVVVSHVRQVRTISDARNNSIDMV